MRDYDITSGEIIYKRFIKTSKIALKFNAM